MKKIFTFAILLLSSNAFAARFAVFFDPATDKVKEVWDQYAGHRFDSGELQGRADVEFDPDLSQVQNLMSASTWKYWKHQSAGVWVAMNAQEQAAVDAEIIAVSTNAVASQALSNVDAFNDVSLAQRSFALVSLDEINVLRQAVNELNKWRADTSTTMAAAANAADLKTRWATLEPAPSSLADRTKAQIIPAVKNKISGGGAD